MANLLGQFKVTISPDVAGAGKVTEAVGNEIDGLDAKIAGSGGIGSKLGKGLVAGAAVGAAAIVGLAGTAASEFASLEQNLGGAEAVFDKSSDSIKKWATNSAANMGLSTGAALESANKMGALFQGMGIEQGKAAEMTMLMSQRAADVASVMGVDLTDAMRAVEGAAKGNFTMMDNLGVPMTNASLNAYALSKGIDQSFESMSQADKIGLAYQNFIEQTAYAEGNFVKENKTLAGSLDILKGSWGSLLGSLGTGDDAMIDGAIDGMITAIENFAGAIVEVLPKIVSGLVKVIREILPELLKQIAALLPELVPAITSGLGEAIGAIVAALPEIIRSLGTALVVLVPSLIDGILAIVDALVQALPGIISELVNALVLLAPALVVGFVQLLLGLVEALPLLIEAIIGIVPALVKGLVEQLPAQIPAMVEGLTQLFDGTTAYSGSILDMVVAMIPTLINSLLEAFGLNSEAFAAGVGNFFMNLPNELGRMVGLTMAGIYTFITDLVNAFPSRMAEFAVGIVAFFQQLPMLAAQFATDLINRFQSLPGEMVSMGQDIVWGLIEGMGSMWNNLMASISGFIDGIKNGFLEGLGIHSPSRWMRDNIGENMGAGVGVGLLDSASAVLRDVDAFNKRIIGGFATDAAIGLGGAEADALAGGTGTTYNTTINQQVPKSDSALDIYLATKRGALAGSPAPSKE